MVNEGEKKVPTVTRESNALKEENQILRIIQINNHQYEIAFQNANLEVKSTYIGDRLTDDMPANERYFGDSDDTHWILGEQPQKNAVVLVQTIDPATKEQKPVVTLEAEWNGGDGKIFLKTNEKYYYLEVVSIVTTTHSGAHQYPRRSDITAYLRELNAPPRKL